MSDRRIENKKAGICEGPNTLSLLRVSNKGKGDGVETTEVFGVHRTQV